MANENKGLIPQSAGVRKKTKKVRNRSGHRVELVIDGKVTVFYPGKTVEVPIDFNVPGGLGLLVR